MTSLHIQSVTVQIGLVALLRVRRALLGKKMDVRIKMERMKMYRLEVS
jgi:hypothetical protein